MPVHSAVRQDEESPAGDPDDDDLDASSGSETESVSPPPLSVRI